MFPATQNHLPSASRTMLWCVNTKQLAQLFATV